jgi:WD40-like Beta Propeller Repeat
MGLRGLFWSLALVGCGSVKETPNDAPTGNDGSTGIDAAPTARCNLAKPFGAPTLVENVNSSNEEFGFSLTRDERTAFIGRAVQPPASSATLLVAQRSASGAFGAPSPAATAAINNTAGDEYAPSPVADGLILYFHRQDAAGIGIYAATRADATAAFSSGSSISVGSTQLLNALSATISADGQTLYWLDFQDFKARSALRGATPTSFGAASVASSIDLAGAPVLSADELTLYYAQGNGTDILVSTRAGKGGPFGTGVPVANINSANEDRPVWLTHDGCVLYLSSNRPGGIGGADIWEARRPL